MVSGIMEMNSNCDDQGFDYDIEYSDALIEEIDRQIIKEIVGDMNG